MWVLLQEKFSLYFQIADTFQRCPDDGYICTVFTNCTTLLRSIQILYKNESLLDNQSLLQQSKLCGKERIGILDVPKVCCPSKTKSDDQWR